MSCYFQLFTQGIQPHEGSHYINNQLQGQQKPIKVGWDNFKIHFIAANKNGKIQILPRKTICVTERKQNFHFVGYWGKKGADNGLKL